MSETTLHAPPDTKRNRELARARHAVSYLESQGLDRDALISCLVSQFDLDERSAVALIERGV